MEGMAMQRSPMAMLCDIHPFYGPLKIINRGLYNVLGVE